MDDDKKWTERRASQRKHLEFVQDIIKREGQNSFAMKGWSITLASAVFAVLVRQDKPGYSFLIVVMPAVLFWILDAYYLRQERLFRKLYDAIIDDINEDRNPPNITPLSMNTSKFPYNWGWLHSARAMTTLLIPVATIVSAILLTIIFNQ